MTMVTLDAKNKLFIMTAGFLVSFFMLISFFLFVNPSDRSLVFIFIPVVLFWLLLFFASQIAIRLFLKDSSRILYVLSTIVVSTIVLLILLSGIGQLSTGDVVLTTCLCAICSFYFYKSWE
jgi:hypothetical protein